MEFIVINFHTWKAIESLGKAVSFSENKKARAKKIKSNRSVRKSLYTQTRIICIIVLENTLNDNCFDTTVRTSV